eukprot:ctg_6393.g665
MSSEPHTRVAISSIVPWSPLMKRRTVSRNLPFHSVQLRPKRKNSPT